MALRALTGSIFGLVGMLSQAQVPAESLKQYYTPVIPLWLPVSAGNSASALRTATPPDIRRRNGATFRPYSPGGSDELLFYMDGSRFNPPRADFILWSSIGSQYACPDYNKQFVFPNTITAEMTVSYNSNWYTPSGVGPCSDLSNPTLPVMQQWSIRDEITFAPPERRKAADGSEFDASRMRMIRNGVPWYSYFWGYKLGLVESIADWPSDGTARAPELATWPDLPETSRNYSLTALPSPWVEDDVVEYVNQTDFPHQPDGQFFYAVRAEDKLLLDSIAAWRRTGKSFKSGGYVSVCRFYGGINGGPNTHFYSADDKECAMLKTIAQLSYEGQTFAVNRPMPAKTSEQAVPGALRDCPVGSKPLYRLYNNASASGGRFVSNHRYTVERADVTQFVAKGWLDEGHVMCVPL